MALFIHTLLSDHLSSKLLSLTHFLFNLFNPLLDMFNAIEIEVGKLRSITLEIRLLLFSCLFRLSYCIVYLFDFISYFYLGKLLLRLQAN